MAHTGHTCARALGCDFNIYNVNVFHTTYDIQTGLSFNMAAKDSNLYTLNSHIRAIHYAV